MRLYSTVQSAEAREISLLAIIETVLCTCGAAYLISKGHWYTLGMAALAPLLLLRTQTSTAIGLDALDAIGEYVDHSIEVQGATGKLVAVLLGFPILVMGAKFSAAVEGFVRSPIDSIAAIPRNWVRYVLCTDIAHVPEMVPGIELDENFGRQRLRFLNFFQALRQAAPESAIEYIVAVAVVTMVTMVTIPTFVISLAYRYSLKSTSLIWAPLLLIAPKFKPVESIGIRLRSINGTSWGRFVAVLSAVIVAGFIAKILIYNGLLNLSEDWFRGSMGELLRKYVEPTVLPWWQLASVVNSVIAIAVYFWASEQLVAIEADAAGAPRTGADALLRTTSVIRATLSLYTSVCLAAIVASHLDAIKFPPLGDKPFPWVQQSTSR